ncbi:hypothetical protein H5410_012798 [Solanum commersonii]|uniref:VOC domain-containing protein n=1 Tax=Solanum commersonii TaxID=4109 RepID=A0A9J6AT59_SOLCO|nr:hypothetical protein H5410_012798 [Solanum commersonii]
MQRQVERKKEQQQQEEIRDHEKEKKNENGTPLMALNHVSRLCKNVEKSVEFYTKVLGFVLIERPQAFAFDGAWLFNYGVGIHLVHAKDNEDDKLPNHTDNLDPMDNHISFQSKDMVGMVQRLEQFKIKYLKRTDPDGFMIEICNCENVKLVPQRSIGRIKFPSDRHNPPVELGNDDSKT